MMGAALYQAGYFDESVTVLRSGEYFLTGGLTAAQTEEAGARWYSSRELIAGEWEAGE